MVCNGPIIIPNSRQNGKFLFDCQKTAPRYYREFLELFVLFLGDIPEGGVSFECPGPMHHTRWMSKVIYSFKVWTSDLALLQQLTAFEEHDKEVAKVTSKKLASHLWYLSEELVGLCLFDDSVPHDMKVKIVQKMCEEGLEILPKRAVVDLTIIQNKTLEDFASTNSLYLLNRMGLQTSFMETNPTS